MRGNSQAVADTAFSQYIFSSKLGLDLFSEVVYINGGDGNLYKQNLASNETLLLIESGYNISVEYYDTDVEQVKKLVSWTFTDEE